MKGTLEDALAAVFAEGEVDPREAARNVLQKRERWARRQLVARHEEFLTGLARGVASGQRRTLQRRLTPGDRVTSDELLERSMWVPSGKGYRVWKKASEITQDDILARLQWLSRFATAIATQARWHWDVYSLMQEEQAATLGDLRSPLPPLPEDGFGLPPELDE